MKNLLGKMVAMSRPGSAPFAHGLLTMQAPGTQGGAYKLVFGGVSFTFNADDVININEQARTIYTKRTTFPGIPFPEDSEAVQLAARLAEAERLLSELVKWAIANRGNDGEFITCYTYERRGGRPSCPRQLVNARIFLGEDVSHVHVVEKQN